MIHKGIHKFIFNSREEFNKAYALLSEYLISWSIGLHECEINIDAAEIETCLNLLKSDLMKKESDYRVYFKGIFRYAPTEENANNLARELAESSNSPATVYKALRQYKLADIQVTEYE